MHCLFKVVQSRQKGIVALSILPRVFSVMFDSTVDQVQVPSYVVAEQLL